MFSVDTHKLKLDFKRNWRALHKKEILGVTLPFIYERVHQYLLLMRFHKPIGIYLLLWPTLWGLWIAGFGHPDARIFLVFVAGVVVMRAAGCVINDYADRKFDGRVRRTKERPLATGRVSPREALLLFAVMVLLASALVLSLNTLTIYLSLVGIALAVIYPFLKRVTHLPQPVLGAAFGWSIPMAFAAQTETVPDIAWLLFIATVFWATAYDTIYSMVDRVDDMKIGLRSTAIMFGEQDKLAVGLMQLAVLFVLVLVGIKLSFSIFYYLGLAIAAIFFIHQQVLIKNRGRKKCFRAFLNNNYIGMTVFIGIVLHYTFSQKLVIPGV